MSATKFHVGDRVEDKKTHERGRVTFVYSTLELRDEFIAVLFNGHDEALAVPVDSVRKISTRQLWVPFRILIAASLSSVFPLSFQVFHSPIDGGDQFMVPLALGPSLFRSQHVGEHGQQVAFFLPNEHGINFSSVSLPMAAAP
jgi:hypothetical protein